MKMSCFGEKTKHNHLELRRGTGGHEGKQRKNKMKYFIAIQISIITQPT
jgi:hypothetical protein